MSRQRGTYRTGYGQPGRPDQKRADLERARGRGSMANRLVRDWSPEMRARIRADPLTPPELAELIDRIAAEEAAA